MGKGRIACFGRQVRGAPIRTSMQPTRADRRGSTPPYAAAYVLPEQEADTSGLYRLPLRRSGSLSYLHRLRRRSPRVPVRIAVHLMIDPGQVVPAMTADILPSRVRAVRSF